MVGLQVGNDYWRIALRQLLTSEQLHAVSVSAVETHNARSSLGQSRPRRDAPVNIFPDYISTAEGSCLIEVGNTRAI
jgi:exosome complex RNA-binding protein Rrp42 (RNase PH superfamily)